MAMASFQPRRFMVGSAILATITAAIWGASRLDRGAPIVLDGLLVDHGIVAQHSLLLGLLALTLLPVCVGLALVTLATQACNTWHPSMFSNSILPCPLFASHALMQASGMVTLVPLLRWDGLVCGLLMLVQQITTGRRIGPLSSAFILDWAALCLEYTMSPTSLLSSPIDVQSLMNLRQIVVQYLVALTVCELGLFSAGYLYQSELPEQAQLMHALSARELLFSACHLGMSATLTSRALALFTLVVAGQEGLSPDCVYARHTQQASVILSYFFLVTHAMAVLSGLVIHPSSFAFIATANSMDSRLLSALKLIGTAVLMILVGQASPTYEPEQCQAGVLPTSALLPFYISLTVGMMALSHLLPSHLVPASPPLCTPPKPSYLATTATAQLAGCSPHVGAHQRPSGLPAPLGTNPGARSHSLHVGTNQGASNHSPLVGAYQQSSGHSAPLGTNPGARSHSLHVGTNQGASNHSPLVGAYQQSSGHSAPLGTDIEASNHLPYVGAPQVPSNHSSHVESNRGSSNHLPHVGSNLRALPQSNSYLARLATILEASNHSSHEGSRRGSGNHSPHAGARRGSSDHSSHVGSLRGSSSHSPHAGALRGSSDHSSHVGSLRGSSSHLSQVGSLRGSSSHLSQVGSLLGASSYSSPVASYSSNSAVIQAKRAGSVPLWSFSSSERVHIMSAMSSNIYTQHMYPSDRASVCMYDTASDSTGNSTQVGHPYSTKEDRSSTKEDGSNTKGDWSNTKGDRSNMKGDRSNTKGGKSNSLPLPRRVSSSASTNLRSKGTMLQSLNVCEEGLESLSVANVCMVGDSLASHDTTQQNNNKSNYYHISSLVPQHTSQQEYLTFTGSTDEEDSSSIQQPQATRGLALPLTKITSLSQFQPGNCQPGKINGMSQFQPENCQPGKITSMSQFQPASDPVHLDSGTAQSPRALTDKLCTTRASIDTGGGGSGGAQGPLYPNTGQARQGPLHPNIGQLKLASIGDIGGGGYEQLQRHSAQSGTQSNAIFHRKSYNIDGSTMSQGTQEPASAKLRTIGDPSQATQYAKLHTVSYLPQATQSAKLCTVSYLPQTTQSTKLPKVVYPP
eukprot:gene26773-4356_t